MAILTNQRFIAGLTVFDTFNGRDGTIVQMNLDDQAHSPLVHQYTGAYFVVRFNDASLQTFTIKGNRIDHISGQVNSGVTLLTLPEKTALMGVGYPG